MDTKLVETVEIALRAIKCDGTSLTITHDGINGDHIRNAAPGDSDSDDWIITLTPKDAEDCVEELTDEDQDERSWLTTFWDKATNIVVNLSDYRRRRVEVVSAAAVLGSISGRAKSPAKTAAARANGKLGGRPKLN